ncbi:hypothetical protein [Vibrio sp. SCSIO 43136]|uniref:hypothetical protein n=1 Tax=Vibrio sp. SCSIO 43136 TaxID=2819101 RepID=UPI00207587DF|nr:hypothetical protein [Vibrio sp. SCSIO 43136]USD67844.1 hypothetical protein J4N39_16805 [Vibrio sp. SCSIO 43136]
MRKTTVVLIVIALALATYAWGSYLANRDLEQGLSPFEAAFTVKSLNPLSSLGYQHVLDNSETWQRHLKSIECKQYANRLHQGLYSYSKHGKNWRDYRDEAIKDTLESCMRR